MAVVDPSKEFLVLQMRVDGYGPQEISTLTGVPLSTVSKIVKTAAEEARRERRTLVDTQFMLHLERTEKLYRQSGDLLARMFALPTEEQVKYTKEILDTIRVMVLILQRQSNLMGLDAQKTQTAQKLGSGMYDWMSDPHVSEERLVAEARRLGVRIPDDLSVKDGVVWQAEVHPDRR